MPTPNYTITLTQKEIDLLTAPTYTIILTQKELDLLLTRIDQTIDDIAPYTFLWRKLNKARNSSPSEV